jgi:hypothetical protein
MARKKKVEAGVRGAKRALIESIGLYEPVATILARARAQGVTVTAPYVYGLRKRRESGGARRPPGRPKKGTGPSASGMALAEAMKRSTREGRTGPVAPLASDSAFRKAAAHFVIEAGALRARAVLEEVVRKIRASSK